jgi:hypothetical protein
VPLVGWVNCVVGTCILFLTLFLTNCLCVYALGNVKGLREINADFSVKLLTCIKFASQTMVT